MKSEYLVGHCGIYCGACRTYLVLKKDLLKIKGYKRGCKGCILQNKKCAFIVRDCPQLRKKEIEYCFECEKFPCQNLKRMDNIYLTRYNVSLLENLKKIKEVGVNKWVGEQAILYTCPECGGEICIHDSECYDCGYKYNLNIT